ncbi:MAG: nucleotidyl transferase AbiEii/AbiGii toxin family protein [Candidatus Gottesmanbacteria bacterium]|nr:nucleotidyl transferase AbiEii/AbiGii toxin family protein [Candidatus Gottesmanbacteria bacterium]
MSKLFLGSLNKNRLAVFRKLRSFRDMGVLGGGTALALQIGHRASFDFDIFTREKLHNLLWKEAKRVFGETSEKILDTEDQLDLITPENVAVTFFHDDYQLLFDPIPSEIMNLLDPRDIATNKAYLLGKRPKWRDYVDLYFLLKENYVSIGELISLSQKKFGTDFSEKLFLEQIVYWGDMDDYIVDFLTTEIEPEEIKIFLENEVKKFVRGELFKE